MEEENDFDNNVFLGNKLTYCWRCKEKIFNKHPTMFDSEIIEELQGKFIKKKMYKFECIDICEDCIDEIQNLIKSK